MSQKERITAPRLRMSLGFSGGGCFCSVGDAGEEGTTASSDGEEVDGVGNFAAVVALSSFGAVTAAASADLRGAIAA